MVRGKDTAFQNVSSMMDYPSKNDGSYLRDVPGLDAHLKQFFKPTPPPHVRDLAQSHFGAPSHPRPAHISPIQLVPGAPADTRGFALVLGWDEWPTRARLCGLGCQAAAASEGLVTPLAEHSSAFGLGRSPATTARRSQGRRSKHKVWLLGYLVTYVLTDQYTRSCCEKYLCLWQGHLDQRAWGKEWPPVPRLPPFCSDQPYGHLPTLDLISSFARFNNYRTTNDTFALKL